ncbi:MAG: glycosyltransferase family 2 protein [Beijerinckiaceae bacterium]|nr:glycosyltransferase family 2 protein [Beijerinckiaceae bacterium]
MDVLYKTPGVDVGAIRVVVVLPTFRRPEMLVRSLASLAEQHEKEFVVIVVENDAAGRQGLAAVQQFSAADVRLACVCIQESRQGNVFALNSGFEAALDLFPASRFILMMDDDEVATPEWLSYMLAAAESDGADIVGGPVQPRFEETPDPSVSGHPVFWPAYQESGRVPVIYGTGNCLIRREVFQAMGRPFLDGAFNFLGGGDADFFWRCKLRGFRFYWEQRAMILETVPPERTKSKWILQRGVRIGAINRRIDSRTRKIGFGKLIVKDIGILALASMSSVWRILRRENPLVALHPFAIAVGRVSSVFKLAPQQYRHIPSKEPRPDA